MPLDTTTDTAASALEFDPAVLRAIANRAWEIGDDYHRDLGPVDRAAFDGLAEACERILFLQSRA